MATPKKTGVIPSRLKVVRGRSLGLDKTEFTATETRALLRFIKEADANKSPYPRRIRMLPSSDT